ncbi:hypothetical protein HDU85_007214 [Gaertneriomyces sp. JEL0708]|nr:hypothetical protein HDU85_007214 [Gaertneriomyces sp. JEL0708]
MADVDRPSQGHSDNPTFESFFASALARRAKMSLLRSTAPPPEQPLHDFSSNDYLSLSSNRDLHTLFMTSLNQQSHLGLGSTGSRLLTGNSSLALHLEAELARIHQTPSALLFNSGYDANLSLLSTLPQPTTAIIYDAHIHASMHDGIKLSRTSYRYAFKHNDIEDLKRILSSLPSQCTTRLIAIESLYSMDGSLSPLLEIMPLLNSQTLLILDEAHSTGVMGLHGTGYYSHLQLPPSPYVIKLHTFGKAIASHGAVVCCSKVIREYLLNYSRAVVYSTMTAPHTLVATRCAYQYLHRHAGRLQTNLERMIQLFNELLTTPRLPSPARLLPSATMIQSIVFPTNPAVVKLAKLIQSRGYDVRPIRSPTVAKGEERVRVCLHAGNTEEEVRGLCEAVRWALDAVVEEHYGQTRIDVEARL